MKKEIMKKRFMIIVFAFVFCLGLAACGSEEGSSSKENPVANVEQTENSTNRNEGQGKEVCSV